jgi:DNA-binding XRE family transcriptional regulator
MSQRYKTQSELADALKLSPETIGAALSGRKLGGMKLANAVAVAMGWEVDILLNSKLPIDPPT